MDEHVTQTTELVKDYYYKYAKFVNIGGRTVPLYKDTLKLPQRRILIAAFNDTKKGNYVKSARIVGDCMGKYHPHGDCVFFNTEVYCLDGTCKTLKEIYDSGVEKIDVLAYDETTDNIKPAVAHSFRIGQRTKTTYKIHLSNGGVVECTDNHPFYVVGDGWVEAEKLKINDALQGGCVFENRNISVASCSKSSSMSIVHKIEKIEYDTEQDMYDFTVDGYANMAIVTKQSDTDVDLLFTHNSSIYGTLVNLVHDGMCEGRGNFGGNYGVESVPPAQFRYTEARISPLIKEIAFKYIDHVPTFINDLGTEEPMYLPTMLPLNLVQFADTAEWTSGIGVGIRFTLPKFKVEQAVALIKQLVEEGTYDSRKLPLYYQKISKPCPAGLFTNGDSTVTIKSRYNVSKNGKQITVTQFPPESNPINILNKIGTFVDRSKNYTDVLIKLERGKYANEYDLDKLFSSKVNLDMLFHDNNKIRRYSIPEIFLSVYEGFRDAVLLSLTKEKEAIEKKINTHILLQRIKPHLNPLNKHALQRITKAEKLEETVVRKLLSYSIDTICNSQETASQLKKDKKLVETKIDTIDEHCISLYGEVF